MGYLCFHIEDRYRERSRVVMADNATANVLDTTDVDRYVGKALPTVELLDPVAVGDIRRWVQGMQYPNPLHYDAEAAERGPHGRIIAPRPFAAACAIAPGPSPSTVGTFPGPHRTSGGDGRW